MRLWAVERGGSPAGGEARLAEEARTRLRLPGDATHSARTLRSRWLWGVAPLLEYARRSLGDEELRRLSTAELGDAIFEVYRIVASRTRFVGRYRQVLDVQEDWDWLCVGLAGLRRGEVP